MSSSLRSIITDESITNGFRVLRDDGKHHDRDFVAQAAKGVDTMVSPDGDVDDTLRVMAQVVHTYIDDTKTIAPTLQKATLGDTCAEIWKFLYEHIQYKNDVKGIEQLRRPSRSWLDRTTGVDCDDFAMFASSILTNLKIPHSFRIAAYAGGFWQHVYVVVPKEGGNITTSGKYWVIDPVLSKADYEKGFSKSKDYEVSLNSLNGMEIDILSGIDDDSVGAVHALFNRQGARRGMAPIPRIISPTNQFRGRFGARPRPMPVVQSAEVVADLTHAIMGPQIEGLGSGDDKEIDNRVYAWLVATRKTAAANPAILLITGENPSEFIGMLDYAIKYWFTDQRETAITQLRALEAKKNSLNGYADFGIEGFEDDSLYGDENIFVQGIAGISGLFKKKDKNAPKKKGFFSKIGAGIKKAASKVATVAKKAVKFIAIKANPLIIAARAGFLLALRLNIGKISAKLKWAYATPEQIQKGKISPDLVNRARSARAKIEKLFVDKLGGKADNLKGAILKSKGGKLGGLGDPDDHYLGTLAELGFLGDLGFLPAAGLAAAIPVITAAIKILKDSGLIGKKEVIDPQADINAATGAGEPRENPAPAPAEYQGDSLPEFTEPENSGSPAPENDPFAESLEQSTEDVSGLGALGGLGSLPDMFGSFVKGNPIVAGGAAVLIGWGLWKLSGSSGSTSRASSSSGLGSTRSSSRKHKAKGATHKIPGKKSRPHKIVLG